MVGMSDFVSGMSAGTHKVRTDDFFSPSETLLTCAVGRRGDHGGDRLSGCGVDFGEQCCVCVGGDLDPGVAEEFGDELEVFGGPVGEGGRCVSEVVESDRGQGWAGKGQCHSGVWGRVGRGERSGGLGESAASGPLGAAAGGFVAGDESVEVL